MNEFVYVNGRLVPGDKAAISVLDYGLLYGFGVFETMRAYNGIVFKMGEHLERLESSGREVGIEYDMDRVGNAVKRLIAANGLREAYVRATLTYGVGKPRLALGRRQRPSLVVFAGRLPDGLEEKKLGGIRAGFSGIRHYSGNPLNRIKTTNYLLTALRKKEARRRRLDDVILLNERNHVVEASTSNIFMVDRKNTLVTPRIRDGCLPGITRATVLEIAGRLDIKAVEKAVKPGELLKAREVFITNSIAEVVPVIQIEGRKIEKGRLTKKLQEEYARLTHNARWNES